MKSSKIQVMVEIAMCAALAIVFDLLPLFTAPQGGSVTLAMLPIFLISFRLGVKQGMLTGLLFTALQFATGRIYYVHPIQVLLDYVVAFGSLGLAGLVYKQVKSNLLNGNKTKASLFIIVGALIGSLARFICHFISGIVFFGSYAPKGTPVSLYSLVYNAWYMVPSFVISAIILVVLLSTAPVLANIKKKQPVS